MGSTKNVVTATLLALIASSAHADYIDSTWAGLSGGTWSTALNWAPAIVPNNGTSGWNFLVHIGSLGSGSPVNLNTIATISGLHVSPDHELRINNVQRLILNNTGGEPSGSISPGVIINEGVIRLNSTGDHTYLQPAGGEVTLTGGGQIILSASPNNWIYRADADGSLVNLDNTIRGSGNLGWSGAPMPITNHGTIRAQGQDPLVIAPGNQPFTNTGTLEADGGTLRLAAGNYDLTGAGIHAVDNATIHLQSAVIDNPGEIVIGENSMVELQGSTIKGGTWTSTALAPAPGSGEMRFTSGTTLLTDPIINNALIRILNSSQLRLQGDVVNTGAVHILSTGANTNLAFVGDVMLSGGGSIEMSAAPNNWIYAPTAGSSLINLDHTITGGGNIGWASVPAPITSHALILANGGPNAKLNFGMASATFTNRGGIRAENDTTILLNGGTYDNATSFIDLSDGCTLDVQNGATIHDGEIVMTNATLLLHSGASIIDCPVAADAPAGENEIHVASGTAHLHNAITTADIFIPNGNQLRLHGDAVSEGTIHIQSTGLHTNLTFVGDVTLSGGGSIEMSAAPNNWIYAPTAGSSLVNLDHTIVGGGNIGWVSQPSPITNHALILANGGPGGRLAFASSMFANRGGIVAENETTLFFHPGTYDSDTSFIEVGEECTIDVQGGATLTKGEIAMAEGSTMLLRSGALIADCAVTSAGEIHVSGTTARLDNVNTSADIFIPNIMRLRLSGSIENAGTIHLNSTGGNTYLQPIGGDVTISGGGHIVLSDFTSNWIYPADSIDTILHNLDNTIEGAGNLGWTGAPMGLVNHGVIRATGAQPLAINCNGPPGPGEGGFVNHGLLEVVGAGGLASAAGSFVNAGEFIIHPETSVTRTGNIQQTSGLTIIDGSLTMSNNMYPLSGGTVAGNGLLNNATLVNTGGTVAPGSPGSPGTPGSTGSTGALTVENYTQNGGTLRIRLGGDTPITQHDQLHVIGEADILCGTLQIMHMDGYEPTKGDEFTIILGGLISGEFDQVIGPAMYTVTYGSSAVTVTVGDAQPKCDLGDLNCDGSVGVADLLILLAQWGPCPVCAGGCPADLDGDGAVGVSDLLILLANWG